MDKDPKDWIKVGIVDDLAVLLPKWIDRAQMDAENAPSESLAHWHRGRAEGFDAALAWMKQALAEQLASMTSTLPDPAKVEAEPANPYKIRWTAATADLTAAQTRLANAQAEKLELENAETKAQLDRRIHSAVLVAHYRDAVQRIFDRANVGTTCDANAIFVIAAEALAFQP